MLPPHHKLDVARYRASTTLRPVASSALSQMHPRLSWLGFLTLAGAAARTSGEAAEWCGAHIASTRRRMDRASTVAPSSRASTAETIETHDSTTH